MSNTVSTRTLPLVAPKKHRAWFQNWALRICAGVKVGTLEVTFPNHETHSFSGTKPGPLADIRLNSWRAVRRMVFSGDMGFAEGYMAGDWTTSDLTSLIELAAVNKDTVEEQLSGMPVVRLFDRLHHLMNPNTKSGSKKNIQAHYDLGNAFYKEWLDPTMTYSSGIYEQPSDQLQTAQDRKYERIAKTIDPKPGQEILEIGCGWGGFASYAARTYGCKVVGLTLSQEQHDFATERMQREGLSNLVEIRLQDYRDVQGEFDGIASIEMFEAVGENNWPQYFETVKSRLKTDARASIQVITIDENRFDAYRKGADFIQRYVFPGGMLPSPTVFKRHAEATGLEVKDTFFFGQSYAHTMAEWHTRFLDAWPSIERIGFDQRFKLLWEYYLAYCRAGFKAGAIDVGQFVLARS